MAKHQKDYVDNLFIKFIEILRLKLKLFNEACKLFNEKLFIEIWNHYHPVKRCCVYQTLIQFRLRSTGRWCAGCEKMTAVPSPSVRVLFYRCISSRTHCS